MTKEALNYLNATLNSIEKCIEEISYLRGIIIEGDGLDDIQKEMADSDSKLMEIGAGLKTSCLKLVDFLSEQK